jgi:hypothetical protein
MNTKSSNDRGSFLKSTAGLALSTPLLMGPQPPAAPVPPPKKARITSSVMLWTLKGSFEEKLATAGAGIQSVELVNEHEDWSDADAAKYKRMVVSYGFRHAIPVPVDQASSLTKAVTAMRSALNAAQPEKPAPSAL